MLLAGRHRARRSTQSRTQRVSGLRDGEASIEAGAKAARYEKCYSAAYRGDASRRRHRSVFGKTGVSLDGARSRQPLHTAKTWAASAPHLAASDVACLLNSRRVSSSRVKVHLAQDCGVELNRKSEKEKQKPRTSKVISVYADCASISFLSWTPACS